MNFHEYSRIYVIGAPGAGKGSLCKKLAEEYGYHHLSVGELLRDLSLSKSLKPDATNAIESNVLVGIEDLIPILRDAVEKLKLEGKNNVVVDGVPRVLEQARPVEKAIGLPDLVLFFNCPEEIAKQRFLTRKIPGRVDDGETFDQRYRHYVAENVKVVEHYRRRGVIIEVDTSGDVEASYGQLLNNLKVRGWRC